MMHIKEIPPAAQRDLCIRLGSVLGQVRAITRMVEEDSPCPEVLHQLIAARSAVEEVGRQLWIEQLAQEWGVHPS